uniref:Cadherin domain-containing protein n=1 Tax=Ciona savignyi TaxID=51511 RepID=H2ZE80_CIOSA
VKLDVIVEDRNDNSPIFNVATLQGSVREDASPGTPVTTVVATDRDDPTGLDQYGFVSYKLATSPEDPPAPGGQRRFAISESGVITVVGNLDVETAPSVKVVIQAKDGMVNSPGNQVTATATIQISDANNRAPVFEGRPYNAKQGELLPLRSTVYSISASDADIDPANKAVTFTITAGDTGGVFDIHSNFQGGVTQGDITLEKPLDYEKGPKQFILTVNAKNELATNSDDTLYQASTTVIIDVLDENEPPVFINQPYNGAVTENQGPEPNIARVRAQDYDFGGNQTVTYAIVSTEGWFSINEEGSISSIAPVDREHPAVNQTSSIYTLVVSSTDNYRVKATSTANVAIRINDKNDNAPEPDGPWTVTICEVPPEPRVTTINIKDKDEPKNGPPFTVTIDDASGLWVLENGKEMMITLFVSMHSWLQEELILFHFHSKFQFARKSFMINLCDVFCSCNDKGELNCETMVPIAGAGFPVALLIAIIAAILILLIIVLAVVAYRRRQQAGLEKEILLDDDDVRENLQAYHDEGGGEEDNDGYDISALQAPPPNSVKPKVIDVRPLGGAQPESRRPIQPDTDIGNYIGDAKQQADNDPTAPPFDSLLVFDYEGQGSDAGSLSSINSGTTDASQDYDYLNNWGPRFKKLADMYGGGESE